MPDLGWDATEELEVQEVSEKEHSVPIFLETVISIALTINSIPEKHCYSWRRNTQNKQKSSTSGNTSNQSNWS